MDSTAENLNFYDVSINKNEPAITISDEFVSATENLFKNAIKVIAIGGGGGNALNHIISHGLKGVDVLAVNTDARDLEMSLSENKIVLGEKTTKGLGAGSIPEMGEKAARESIAQVRAYLKGADMVYIAAGMGGGTGTGAAPIVARAAKEMGILTVAVVTKPFAFEGSRRARYADEGIAKLFPEVDALIVVPNEKLLELSEKDTTFIEAFTKADEVLRQAVQGVTDLVTRPGLVNVDFADLRSVMKGAGRSVMGIGKGKGENAVEDAIRQALDSPLMECSMQGAKGVLMNILHNGTLSIRSISNAASIVEDVIDEDAQFIWGCVEDCNLENEVEVTIVAAGFDESEARFDAPKPKPVRTAEIPKRAVEKPTRTAEKPKPKPAPTYQARHARSDSYERQTSYIPELEEVEMEPADLKPRRTEPKVQTPSWLSNQSKHEENSSKDYSDMLEIPSFKRYGMKLKGTFTE